MSRKVLVTGGAGYIGSSLVPELLRSGHEVHVVDNFLFSQSSLNSVCSHPNFTVTNGDVRDKELMSKLYPEFDVIYPLAGLVGAPICKKDPVAAETVNHDAIIHMLESVSDQQIIIMPTTNSAYGSGDSQNFCDESSPLNPISKYAIDKVAIEEKLMQRKNSISLRLATVFGMSPRMRMDLLVNDFVYRAVSDKFVVLFEGHFKRNYIHVRDVVSVFIHALANFETMRENIYNVGLSDANVSKTELCEIIKKKIPDFVFMEAPLAKDPDQRNYIVSNKKIESTGWSPNFSLDDGITELIKGYTMLKNRKYGNV